MKSQRLEVFMLTTSPPVNYHIFMKEKNRLMKKKQTHNPFADFFGDPSYRAARELKLHHRLVKRLEEAQPTGRLARKFAERRLEIGKA